ncbi:uncharacterized protein LOC115695507 [Cannabis sativa]|uniref:uncharacterized protein LOC115695507 n=1 Tax=Cannabis sativa TaxID=3483 RepID=UPI0029CA32FB|nr:uncharacterized protein LOC115695507 [Cannabis sativa]
MKSNSKEFRYTFGDYYCDICEEERDPRLRVYYCGHCKYVAHVHCVISEVMNVLKGDIRDVKLKVLGEDAWDFPNKDIDYPTTLSSLVTLNDLIHKLYSYELYILKWHFDWNEEKEKSKIMSNDDDKADEVLKLSSFTESDFMKFMLDEFHSFFGRSKLKIKGNEVALKIVDVKGHMVPFNLASVIKYLLHKHGDITTDSRRSQYFKGICFYFVCKVMKEMHTTLVTDITKRLLHQWYHYIRFVRYYTAFEVGFLEESLWKITRYFYYQQVSKVLETEFPMKIEKKKAELLKKIAEYDAGLENCKKLYECSRKKGTLKEGLEMENNFRWKSAREIGSLK